MDFEKAKKIFQNIALGYWILVIVIYLIARPQFHMTRTETNMVTANGTIGEIYDGITVRQRISVDSVAMEQIKIVFETYDRDTDGKAIVILANEAGTELLKQELDISDIKSRSETVISADSIDVKDMDSLYLTVTTEGCETGNGITIYSGNSFSVGNRTIAQEIKPEDLYEYNGESGNGRLCVSVAWKKYTNAHLYFWIFTIGFFVLCFIAVRVMWQDARKENHNLLVALCLLMIRYRFLLKQLVMRDFKKKYKRSVLGIAWSFLSPLMSMSIQFIVFSQLFKSNIPNYAVYLLTGVVFMNYFVEAVSFGMMAIVDNGSLIKKVYVPKYIYPIAKVISSTINFMIAFIPLTLIMIVTGTRFSFSLLLLVFDLLCILGFILGMVMMLSTSMTFFIDTQFLWNIFSMMWIYSTPVFYPETIIPESIRTIYHMNPMYQYITFARTCILEGVSPEPLNYLWCILSSFVVFTIGSLIFKKNQDKFILYL